MGLDGSDDIESVVAEALRTQLDLFEVIVNLVRRNAPDAAIAFDAGTSDIVDATLRWLG